MTKGQRIRNEGIARLLILVVAAFLSGMFAGVGMVEFFKPNCPAEDSCTANYYVGKLHIEEVKP